MPRDDRLFCDFCLFVFFDSEDMFKSAMTKMSIDVKKMPLGQLSEAQVGGSVGGCACLRCDVY